MQDRIKEKTLFSGEWSLKASSFYEYFFESSIMQQTLFWELFIFHVNRAEAALFGAGAALEAFALVDVKLFL